MPSKEVYWKNREKYIKDALTWNKENPDKRRVIMKKDNEKRKLKKRIWHENKWFGGNTGLLDNGECFVCGNEHDLIIHHRDGNNGRNGRILNNERDNLVVLCRKCHPTFHSHSRVKEVYRGGI